MAKDPIVGTWVVTLFQGPIPRYKYKYACSSPGKTGAGAVRWEDYWDATTNGSGTWRRSGSQINFDWTPSRTQEYLVIAPVIGSDKAGGQVSANYGEFITVAERIDTVDPSADPTQDLMQQWAANFGDFSSPFICPWALPYPLAMKPGHAPYKSTQMGGPIRGVRGLAVHTTWTDPGADMQTTVGSCINTWNGAGVKTGAHFILLKDGVLVQVVPTNRIAYAQGGNGDPFWLSVEIQTKNSPATPAQVQAARILFQWVVNTYGCDRKLAMGYVGAYEPGEYAADAKRDYDPITRQMCGGNVTTKTSEAQASSGLSCHYWLHPVKPCPGKPLLRQLGTIAQGW